jgi:thiol-disulfide isomerase/thioredoxin
MMEPDNDAGDAMKRTMLPVAVALLLCCAAPAAGQDTVAVGLPAPTFFLPALDGSRFFLSDHVGPQGGKVVVLDFWATWCRPCKRELPLLDALVRKYPRESVLLVLVNVGEKRDTVLADPDAARSGWPVLLDQFSAISAKYGVDGLPSLFIIGRDGVLRYAAAGYDEKAGLKAAAAALDAAVKGKPLRKTPQGRKPGRTADAGK